MNSRPPPENILQNHPVPRGDLESRMGEPVNVDGFTHIEILMPPLAGRSFKVDCLPAFTYSSLLPLKRRDPATFPEVGCHREPPMSVPALLLPEES